MKENFRSLLTPRTLGLSFRCQLAIELRLKSKSAFRSTYIGLTRGSMQICGLNLYTKVHFNLINECNCRTTFSNIFRSGHFPFISSWWSQKKYSKLYKIRLVNSDTGVFFLGLSFRCSDRVNCSLLVLSGLSWSHCEYHCCQHHMPWHWPWVPIYANFSLRLSLVFPEVGKGRDGLGLYV